MTGVRVVVDAESGVAPWRQIYDQIERMIASGALPPGARLPSIRQLARDLGLASGTVARVYRELETTALVETGRSRGTVVAEPVARPDRTALLHAEAARFAGYACDLGVGVDTAIEAVRTAWPGDAMAPGSPDAVPGAR
ncbi:MAG TPA: GntR family transcriptional regulator [Mycobacteriales bacterium]|jgi:DNA-binding transcriptional regulator YhcF (GntR family)|nr:GntR family transcriptional regulator [Mycobacteriales bacterium]